METNFDFAEWLQNHTNYEDPDSRLLFSASLKGVKIQSFNGDLEVDGVDLEDACNQWDEICY